MRKVYKQLVKESIDCGKGRVERLMKALSIKGRRRGGYKATTKKDSALARPADLVGRIFKADAPNKLWVADLTYVKTRAQFAYVAFVVDVFAGTIVGWSVASHMRKELVLDALDIALWARRPKEGLVHHSDQGSVYLSIKYSQRLEDSGISSSVGAVACAYDNALAESINGLFKSEVIDMRIEEGGSWNSIAEVELAVAEWVKWFNEERLFGRIGYVAPLEYEQQYLEAQHDYAEAA